MNSNTLRCNSKTLKLCVAYGKHSLLPLSLLFPLGRTSKASNESGSKTEQVQSTGFTPSLRPSRLPLELPGSSTSELYMLPAVRPDRGYLQLGSYGTSLHPGLVNIQSWAVCGQPLEARMS